MGMNIFIAEPSCTALMAGVRANYGNVMIVTTCKKTG
jgi:hypothetical protein